MRHSKLWVLFHHPLGTLWRCFLMLLVSTMILMCFSIKLVGNTANCLFSLFCIYVGLFFTQRHYNKEEPYLKVKKNHKFLKFLFSSTVAISDSMDRKQKAIIEPFVYDFLMPSPPSRGEREAEERRRQEKKQADMAVRARYDALDRAYKAEYDARDAALRGKDKAAYQYQNQADYWYNQSKR